MGEIAALATSVLWSLTSIQFTLAGRRIGVAATNRIRLLLATLFLSLAHLVLQGELWPLKAELFRWGWLGLSGIVGLALGDTSLFQALVLIGPRRSMLMMTLAPIISSLLAWGFLGETLQPIEVSAALLAIAGTAWVVSEGPSTNSRAQTAKNRRQYVLGVLYGLGGALGQALGLVLATQGLTGNFPALSATLIRMVVASSVIWFFALIRGQVKATSHSPVDRNVWLLIAGGSLTGPFLGVWCSMIAVQGAPVGIASTLMALSPILLVPLEHWLFGEKVSARAITGTIVALAGAALIFLT
ncbi:MAG: DMT family transporter [Candidatus Omnitrophica bacterium]|nr:DMT family transporter [Candidatus Omnitrophota bacterium]